MTARRFSKEDRELADLMRTLANELNEAIDRVEHRAEQIAAERDEPVWVRQKDEVRFDDAGRGLVACESPISPGMVVVRHGAGDGLYSYTPMDAARLRTLDGRPVAGVRVGEFSEDDMIHAMRDMHAHCGRPPIQESHYIDRFIRGLRVRIRARRKGR